MRKLVWLFLLIGIHHGWAQEQLRARVMESGEKQSDTLASLTTPLTPRTPPIAGSVRPLQLFECSGNVTLETCRQEALRLKPLLNKYGADQLGQWKWVLVSSQQWELLLTRLGLSPNVPAFTALDAKVTFFDDALFDGSTGRLSQLMESWALGRNDLLDLAVRHELSHALCNDRSELRVVHNARLLDEKKSPICDAPPKKSSHVQRLRCH